MELYQFLTALTFIYFINIFNFFLLIFSGLMVRHFYKKKISNYEVKGTNKTLVKIFKYPKMIYNKLASYEYDNIFFKSIFYCYDKVNNIYNIFIEEVLTMFSDLFYEVVNDHMEKNSNNMQNPRFIGFLNKNPDAFNNMFMKMIDKMPDPYQMQNLNNKNLKLKSSSILDDIKKFNNLNNTSSKNKIEEIENTKNKNIIENISDEDIDKFIQEDYMDTKEKLSDKDVDRILDEELENLFKDQQDLNKLQESLKNLTSKFNDFQEEIL